MVGFPKGKLYSAQAPGNTRVREASSILIQAKRAGRIGLNGVAGGGALAQAKPKIQRLIPEAGRPILLLTQLPFHDSEVFP